MSELHLQTQRLLGQVDPELARRARAILRKWSMVSEGPAGSPASLSPPERAKPKRCPKCRGNGCPRCRGRGTVSAEAKHRNAQPHHGSSEPTGSSVSAFSHYLRWFQASPNEEALEARIDQAEQEYATHTGRNREAGKEQGRASAIGAFGDDGASMEEAQAKRILREYQGKTAEQVARLEGDTRIKDWVEKVRRQHGYDENGIPRRAWDTWDEQTKVVELRKLRGRGIDSKTQAAEHFEVSRTTIRALWEKAHPRRAA